MFFPILDRFWGLPWWLSGKESACNAGDTGGVGSIPGWEDPLEEGLAAQSSILAWRIPWTEEPSGIRLVYGFSKSDTIEATEHEVSGLLSFWKHFLHFTLRLFLYFDPLPISLALSQLSLRISTSFLQLPSIETHQEGLKMTRNFYIQF